MRHSGMGNNFQFWYLRLLTSIIGIEGIHVNNKRTGHCIRLLPHGASCTVPLFDGTIPVPGLRRFFPATAAAETAWQLLGEQSTQFIAKHTPIWRDFEDRDGHVENAYGYRWRAHFGRDQVAEAIDAIELDPTDRQVVVMAWDPSRDALSSEKVKNVPCPVMFQLYAWDEPDATYLSMALTLRSSDVYVGLPYDIANHALLLYSFVEELNRRTTDGKSPWKPSPWKPGLLQVHAIHPHIYEVHVDAANKAVHRAWKIRAKHGSNAETLVKMPPAPVNWAMRDIEFDPDGYVATVTTIQAGMDQPGFHDPRPEVVK